jgi:hypothetical protein
MRKLQRVVPHEATTAPAVPTLVHEVLDRPGQPLAPATLTFMGTRFGHEFSKVRVHTDARAAESARAMGALAYTVGRDVVFGTGQYAPGTIFGRRVLAHELAHVLQQGGTDSAPAFPAALSPDHTEDAHEQEAHQIAERVVSGTRLIPSMASVAPGGFSRAPVKIQRLGANANCSVAEQGTIHQAIFNARGWLNKAIASLESSPLPKKASESLRRNFGPTYGVVANVPLILGRLRVGYQEISTIPFSCAGIADATCATGACGYAIPGGDAATICSNATLVAGTSWVYQAGCVLHESFHAAFSNFTVDEYSGWHGQSSSTPTFPGAGTDPLLNADSYTTLVMDLT